VWSACNIGSTQSYKGISSSGIFNPIPSKDQIGHYFQWGKMTGWISQAWQYPTQGYLYPGKTFSQEIYNPDDNSGSLWELNGISQGPCDHGYHVPSSDEWMKAFEYIGIWKQNEFNNKLKLSAEYNLGTGIATLYHEGWYWSSTTDYWSWSPQAWKGSWAIGQVVSESEIMYSNSYTNSSSVKWLTSLIRCIKN
jgi:hypothetical protein